MALQKSMKTRNEGLKWPSSKTFPDFSSSKGGDGTTHNPTLVVEPTVVVLDWTKLDTSISNMDHIRRQVGFLLSEYRSLAMKQAGGETPAVNSTKTEGTETGDDDVGSENERSNPALEIVVLLESPGGSVADYGLAGQHLLRLRNEPGITLTICVDKVAASGGYMLCCTASPGQLFAAPFALLGSIGVIATTFNANRLLTDWGVQPIEFKGGRYKAPIGPFGKISKEGRRITQSMVDDTHAAFKNHVATARPILKDKIEEIGNGQVWLGVNAINLNLVDAIKTSDEYIEEKIRYGTRVYKMVQIVKTGFLLGPGFGHLNTAEPRRSFAKDSSAATTIDEDVEDMMQKSRVMMARLPAQVKSLFSKSYKSFR